MVAGPETSPRMVRGQHSIGKLAVAETFPLVSILTPSFNREDLVAETLESICAQTWPHWENIVVDDGSTDRTKEIVASYAAREPRIKLFDRSRGPKGACTCRNEGVRLSSGKYVMFLDTDDLIEPFCLEQRVAVMETRPELDFAIFPSYLFEKIPHDLGLLWNIDKPDDPLSRLFRHDGLCQGTGVLWRKESFDRMGMWDESLAIWQDVDLFFRAFIQGYRYEKCFDLKPDLHNRVNPASLSRADYHSIAKAQSRAKVVRDAVDRLKANGMADRVHEARFMAGEVVLGAFRSRRVELAADMLRWARKEGVLSPPDALALRLFGLLHGFGLGRFHQMARLLAPLEERFSTDSTLGLVSSRAA